MITTQLGANSRDELAHSVRLGDVVVGADLDAEHDVEFLVARAQHDDGRRDPAVPHGATDVDARHPGEHHVDEDDVRVVPLDGLERLGAVTRTRDGEALATEADREREQLVLIVLDDEDARPLGPFSFGRHTVAHAALPGCPVVAERDGYLGQ